MTNWSFSRLRCFRDCPQRFKLRYLDKAPEEPIPLFEFGSELHRLIEEYSLHCYEAGLARDHKKARMMSQRYDDKRLREVVLAFADNITLRRDLVYTEGSSIEQSFEVPLSNGDTFRGRIDLVEFDPAYSSGEGRWELTDYSGGWPDSNFALRKRQQLLCYARAWYDLHGGRHWKLQESYPESGCPPLEYITDASELTWDWVLDWIERINAETEFEPRPSQRNCQACGYHSRCSAPLPTVLNEATSVVFAEHYVLRQAMDKEIKGLLQQYTQEHGNIETEAGEEVGWHYEQGKTRLRLKANDNDNGRAFIEACLAANINPYPLVNSSSNLNKFLLPAYEDEESDEPIFVYDMEARKKLLAFCETVEAKPAFKVRFTEVAAPSAENHVRDGTRY